MFAVVERAGPHRLPLAAADGERPRRARRRSPRRARRVSPGRSPPVAPSRSCSPSSPPDRAPRTSPTRAWSSRPRRMRRSTRRPSSSGSAPCSSTSTPSPCAPTRPRWPPPIDDTTVLVVASAPSYAHGVVDPVTEIAAAGRRARHPLPRRRLHRRLGAAAPRRHRPVDLRGRRRHQHQRRPAQVRLHAQGRLGAAAPHPGAAARPLLRLGELARATRCSTARCSRPGRAGRWPRPGPSPSRIGVEGYARAGPPRPARRPSRSADAVDGIHGLRGARPAGLDPGRPGHRRLLRRLHHRRRDARARVVRPAADVVPRRPADPAPHPVGGHRPVRARARRGAARVGGRRPRRRPGRPRPGSRRSAGRDRPGRPSTSRASPGCSPRPASPADDGALALPRRMAPVNALLDACPPALREALLLGVLDRLSRPTGG